MMADTRVIRLRRMDFILEKRTRRETGSALFLACMALFSYVFDKVQTNLFVVRIILKYAQLYPVVIDQSLLMFIPIYSTDS